MKLERPIKINDSAYQMSEVMRLIKTMNPGISIDGTANFVADLCTSNNTIKDAPTLNALWNNYHCKTIIKGSYDVLCDIERANNQTDLKIQSYYKSLENTALIQAALKNKGFNPRVYSIYRYLDLWEALSKFNKAQLLLPNLEMIKKAHADGAYTAQEVVTNQKKYQNWLSHTFNGDMKVIMSCHRSVGFEYEFATYNLLDKGETKSLQAHTMIGYTHAYSKLYQIPFTLETDTHNELEIGFPPFLIVNCNSKINRKSIKKMWRLFKKAMHHIYLQSKNGCISGLIDHLQSYQLGNPWTITNAAKTLKITKRKKHREKKEQVYSHVNLSLTTAEVAAYIKNHGVSTYRSERYEYFDETYRQLYAAFKSHINTLEGAVAIIHLCKGLSSLLAIPSLLLLKENPQHLQNNRGIYSTVKEVYGVWIKDSIPNLVDSSLKSKISRNEVKQAIHKEQKQIGAIMECQMQKAFEIIQKIRGAVSDHKEAAVLESKNMIKAVKNRLERDYPILLKPTMTTTYRKENFPSNGNGVRKETYRSLISPKDMYFHIAEFRNDVAIELFLSTQE
ncbi:hypothetical protein Q4Q35_11820 [Flavivirga aquimarina]|uniref:Uncharacterized protein n=1 Tax=Flavivirga aquimarina TaxID=2027862 RepID=A0ABT8WBT0_9FLAO|nr:hypothetical protein [Flavivirga aquimarina]MDO5970494.1 hypothetical protein [Flavivirga aquimarina]